MREDPVRPGLLYLGTENAVYVSFDDGALWQPLQSNLPHAPVHWLTIQERFSDLVVATYGRGFWILDDMTPLRELADDGWPAPQAGNQMSLHLFEPRPAYRFRYREPPQAHPEDPAAGDNPAYGASLHYYLEEGLDEDVELRVEIVDGTGAVIRTLGVPDEMDRALSEDAQREPPDPELPREAGLHRLYWDLRHEKSRAPRLRTRPLEHAHVAIPDRGWRPLGEGNRIAPLAAPGIYDVRLRVGERELTRPLRVLRDPASAGSDQQIAAQVTLLLEIRSLIDQVSAMVDELEWLRKQIDDLQEMVAARQAPATVARATADELDQALIQLEGRFFDLRLTGGTARQDTLRWPRRLYAKLTSLAGYIGGSDHPPSDAQLEVLASYQEQLASARARLSELRGQPLERLNDELARAGLGRVVAGLAWPAR